MVDKRVDYLHIHCMKKTNDFSQMTNTELIALVLSFQKKIELLEAEIARLKKSLPSLT